MPTDRDFGRRVRRTGQAILLVDDDAFLRRAIANTLRVKRFSVTEAASGEGALELLEQSTPYDLVLSDLNLRGEIDGLSLARWLAARQPDLPIILITGRMDLVPPDLTAPVLPKPFRLKQLLALIEKAIGEGESPRER